MLKLRIEGRIPRKLRTYIAIRLASPDMTRVETLLMYYYWMYRLDSVQTVHPVVGDGAEILDHRVDRLDPGDRGA